jgi:hypothetical protein
MPTTYILKNTYLPPEKEKENGKKKEERGKKKRKRKCSVSRWRPQKVDKRMVLEHTHGLFIT